MVDEKDSEQPSEDDEAEEYNYGVNNFGETV